MEPQAGAQGERPQPAVVLDPVPLHHLRLRRVAFVEAVQRVEHEEGVVAGDVGRDPHRVELREVGLRREHQRAGAGGAGEARHRQGRGPGGDGLEGVTPPHGLRQATRRRSARHRINGWMRVPKASMPSRKSSNVSMMPFTPGKAATSSSILATVA